MPSKYLLASFTTCPWVQRAAIVLQEKNVAYDIDYIDRDNRPDWFLAISPHSKVPVLQIDGEHALFESNAIAEYLDETVPPRLHPEDPIVRARNRAWTDYVATFSGVVSSLAYSMSEDEFNQKLEQVPNRFALLEQALGKRGNDGPFFNGPGFSLVDAAYAPSLQRFTFVDRIRPLGIIEDYPLLSAWRNALIERASVKASTIENFEDHWREALQTRNRWVAKFLGNTSAAAE